LHTANAPVFQHDFNAMRVAGAFGKEAGDDAFGEHASALVLFFDDADAEAGAEGGARGRRHGQRWIAERTYSAKLSSFVVEALRVARENDYMAKAIAFALRATNTRKRAGIWAIAYALEVIFMMGVEGGQL
jgi:hypothetical protein